tara:strand:+ start:228 stop:398 length:171 start_codon:yes stop_codon:yes gene_type:complete
MQQETDSYIFHRDYAKKTRVANTTKRRMKQRQLQRHSMESDIKNAIMMKKDTAIKT